MYHIDHGLNSNILYKEFIVYGTDKRFSCEFLENLENYYKIHVYYTNKV